MVGVVGSCLLLFAEGVSDLVGGRNTSHVGHGILNDNTVLNVDSLDGTEGSGGSSIVGDELSDNGEGLGGIDGLAGAVEGLVSEAERIEITTLELLSVFSILDFEKTLPFRNAAW